MKAITEAQRLSKAWATVQALLDNYADLGHSEFYRKYMVVVAEIALMDAYAKSGTHIGDPPPWSQSASKEDWADGEIKIHPSIDKDNEGSVLVYALRVSELNTFTNVEDKELLHMRLSDKVIACMKGKYWLGEIDINAI
jgi:hypothetical protein